MAEPKLPDNLHDTVLFTLDDYLNDVETLDDVDTHDLTDNLVRRVLAWLDNPLRKEGSS